MNKICAYSVGILALVIAVLLFVGKENYISKRSYKALTEQNAKLVKEQENFKIANKILVENARKIINEKTSLLDSLKLSEQQTEKIAQSYNQMKTEYYNLLKSGITSELSPSDVIELCDEYVDELKTDISTMKLLAVKNEKLIQNLNQQIGNEQGFNFAVIQERDNYKEMLSDCMSEIKAKDKRIRNLKIQKYLTKAAAIGIIGWMIVN